MSPQEITHLILQYRYWILVPLSIIEGPMVAFIAGTLASLGYFNLPVLAIFFFVRDIGMDGIYYATGYFFSKTAFAKRMLDKMNIKSDRLDEIRTLWEKHPARIMFAGKLSYGIAQAFIVAAGTVKMRIQTFFTYGAIVAITQYGAYLLLGYFFGNAFGGNTSAIIENLQYVIAGAAFIITIYYLFRWHMRTRLARVIK